MTNKAIRTKTYREFAANGNRTWANPHEVRISSKVDGDGGGRCENDGSGRLYEGPNPNVTVWQLGNEGKIAVLSEGERGRIIALDGGSLDTLEVIDTIDTDEAFLHAAHFYGERSSSGSGGAAGEESGFHVALVFQRHENGRYTFGYALYHGVASSAPLRRVAAIPVLRNVTRAEAAAAAPKDRLCYQHTLAVTPNFVVLFGSDRRLDYEAFLKTRVDGGAAAGFFNLWPNTGTNASLHVFRRGGGGASSNSDLVYVGEAQLERPHMIWHTANAFEAGSGGEGGEGGESLVVDVTSMLPVRQRRLARFALRVSPGNVECVQDVDLSLDVQEFPNINPFYHGRRHRYVFGLSYPYLESSRLYKYDLEENTHRVWGGGNTADGGCYIPSEPVFSPRPGATDEDDGVVLSMVSVNGSDAADESADASFLLILDGQTFEEVARVETPVVVNHGIHSIFLPALSSPKLPDIARY